MEKIILKTSKQAMVEKSRRNAERECPECLKLAIGTVSTRNKGFLNIRTQKKKTYICFDCGCEWTTGWVNI